MSAPSNSRTQQLGWAIALGLVLLGGMLWGLNSRVAAEPAPPYTPPYPVADTAIESNSLDLAMWVNYGHNWIEGHYEPGHTVWLTVTDSAGAVRATAELTTEEIPWWGGETGFSTNVGEPWLPQQPNIQPYDWVYGLVDNGYAATLRVGDIGANLDVDADTVTGVIDAPWLDMPLGGSCAVWEEGGVRVDFTTDMDGAYACDLGAAGWDLLPGQQIAVEYQDPEGSVVINVFEEPAPRVQIEKWADGQPAEGGNFVFEIQYRNEGEAPAEDVVITDTMVGFDYLSDTSGLPYTTDVTPGGDPYVVWELGTLEPGDWTSFDVFVAVTADSGMPVQNTAEIATSNPYNRSEPWQLEATWEGSVSENDTRLNVGKGAWTGDPAPGHEFVYDVTICNNGSTGSTAVTLTDTLPLSTTLVHWWSREAGWEEVDSGDHLLVVERPSIGPGCSDVLIRVHLDEAAGPGMELVNEAVISAENDLEPEHNQVTFWHHTRVPYKDLALEKSWHWGTLVPGGHLRYGIHFVNQGNVPVSGPIRITDTLPVSTTFYDWHGWGDVEISLVEATENQVVWELDGLDNGFGGGLELALNVAHDALPGTVLVNQAEIAPQPDEVDVRNNLGVWEETVYPHGPNLRLRKEARWHDHDPGRSAWYRLEVENVGDATVDNVTITDHYPSEMVLDGEPHLWWWEGWEWADHPDQNFFTVTLESLEPGWSAQIHYDMRIPGDDPVPLGLVFTNTADVTLVAEDTNPDDNVASAVLGTGPDLYVEKSVVGGEVEPGGLITFNLAFGNDQPWPTQGNVWLIDTLPEGMSYVSAQQRWVGPYQPWSPIEPDEVDGQDLIWNFGPAHDRFENEIRVTVQITDTATWRDRFTNYVEIFSDQPDVDIEPFYDNNQDSVTVGVEVFDIHLPVVLRD